MSSGCAGGWDTAAGQRPLREPGPPAGPRQGQTCTCGRCAPRRGPSAREGCGPGPSAREGRGPRRSPRASARFAVGLLAAPEGGLRHDHAPLLRGRLDASREVRGRARLLHGAPRPREARLLRRRRLEWSSALCGRWQGHRRTRRRRPREQRAGRLRSGQQLAGSLHWPPDNGSPHEPVWHHSGFRAGDAVHPHGRARREM
mmetsp:Transcript_94926/g.283468  ORF Transcript_94926/g.283468 Transcript_94926/m.283468 type:complete len:201 (+) Transcript_94926:32-634(+)